ncbi:hypothetical protein AARAC_003129 [Aspergillus arachidicola]|uniref:Uncharacterized protein n=1 Tax=Aspergillus arachidicola TaxID=656916 RepID=A0A2G7FQC0_9EURO|nr:hypothetical protein AARAC_003129 [Aspergillus arachidicola]
MSKLSRNSSEQVESSESPQTELSLVLMVPPSAPQQLFGRLKNEIITASNVPAAYIKVEGVAPEVGCSVAKKLFDDDEVERLTHAGVFAWACYELFCGATSGFLTSAELRDISLCTIPRYYSFRSPWLNAYKEPDTVFDFAGTGMPSVVVESPYVNAVLLMKWSVTGNKVAGYLELHRRSGVSPRLKIFPTPPPGAPIQTLAFQRQDFYPVGQVPAGRNPNDIWLWNMDKLRDRTACAMADDGLVPA